MTTATLTSKGQITIPAQVRQALKVETGDRIEFVEVEPGRFELIAATQSLRGFRARPSSALDRRPVQAQSAAIAGYGEHLQRRLGVFGRDERA